MYYFQRMMSRYDEQYCNDSEIYFHRCELIKSKEGRKVELVTISSVNGQTGTEKAIPNIFTGSSDTRPAW